MAWVEAGVIGTIVGGVVLAINKYTMVSRSECKGRHGKLERRLCKDEGDYLTERMHEAICSKNMARVEKHISDEIHSLKDEMWPVMRDIQSEIKKNGKK